MELLAEKLRPKCLDDVIGQKHLVSKGKVIYNLVKNKKLFSMILYGNPGIGKTSIACAIVNELGCRFRMLNAVINNKSDFDVVIEEAKMYGEMVLIVDEIHRMNKDKQDILLPLLENGLIILIGLTTSNPYYKINPAIRSRCQIFELHNLEFEDILEGLNKAKKALPKLKIDDDALKQIAYLSSGDFRSALNLLEVAYYSSLDFHITLDSVKSINAKPAIIGDMNESGHYDLISAFQKSIRGSDVDASLYYLGRLIAIGDLDIIYRRMTVIAYEDIGLANPGMGPKVRACIESCEMLGLPEARIPLSVTVIELALSPKSNSGEESIDAVLNDIENGASYETPAWIKTNSKDYKYPHAYPKHWVKQQYLPDKLKNKKYYKACNNKYENGLNQINKEMKE
ncbi:MAG: replication-associated recombination protein A [Bacilli bacterium]|nr:replication-associated recombination protein A [Bacilli bacterium]